MNEEISINPNTIAQVFKSSFKNENSKANKEALLLSSEFLRLFTIEAVHRASEEQENMNRVNNSTNKTIQTEHLERILPQLLLDF